MPSGSSEPKCQRKTLTIQEKVKLLDMLREGKRYEPYTVPDKSLFCHVIRTERSTFAWTKVLSYTSFRIYKHATITSEYKVVVPWKKIK
uniref:Uncharacterized protein n=1 Tax=Paramormyrops kingsleyae TaxID=1676925 RepID=A0A3B3TAV9_9TELE